MGGDPALGGKRESKGGEIKERKKRERQLSTHVRRILLFAPFIEGGGGQRKVSGDDRARSQEVSLNMEDKKPL